MICFKCNIDKQETEEFFELRKDTGKFRGECKECKKKYNLEYKKNNEIKIKLLNKQHYENNKEYYSNLSKKWNENNKEKAKQLRKKWYENNKDHARELGRKRYWENLSYYKEKSKEYRNRPEYKEEDWERGIKNRYGIDSKWYYDKLNEQNGCCAICKNKNPGTNINKFHVDHYEFEGKKIARGLLCGSCNPGIGFLKHDEEILIEALNYLRKFK